MYFLIVYSFLLMSRAAASFLRIIVSLHACTYVHVYMYMYTLYMHLYCTCIHYMYMYTVRNDMTYFVNLYNNYYMMFSCLPG